MTSYNDDDFWEVTDTPRNLWFVPKCTWRDILAATDALNALEGGEIFAPLHRCEGGFMCVSGPGFTSDEPTEGPWNRDAINSTAVARKALRFEMGWDDYWDWPSRGHSFSEATPDEVIFRGGEVIRLRFEGQYCKRWTKKRCAELLDAVAKELKWEPIKRKGQNFHRKVLRTQARMRGGA